MVDWKWYVGSWWFDFRQVDCNWNVLVNYLTHCTIKFSVYDAVIGLGCLLTMSPFQAWGE